MTAALSLPAPTDGYLPDDWATREWTVDQLASLPQDLRFELIDGRLVLPSPTALHNEIANRVWMAMLPNCPSHLLVTTDMSIAVNRKNEPRPDVVIIETALATRSPVPVEKSLFAIEVISPSSGIYDTHTKPRIYAKAGIPDYLVIHPAAQPNIVLWHYRLTETGHYKLLETTDGEFTTDRPYPMTIDLPALTARRKEIFGHVES